MMRLLPVLLFVLLLLAAIWPADIVAQEQAPFVVAADSLVGDYDSIRFPALWKYNAADDPAFANPAYDDSDWPWEDTHLLADQPLTDDWQGLGWFRLSFRVDSALVGIPLGIRLLHYGAAEVYLDGDLLYTSGTVGTTPETTEARIQKNYYLFSFREAGVHVLVVRYANHRADAFQRMGWYSGFSGFFLRDVNGIYESRLSTTQRFRAYQFALMGIYFGFALLHLILFAFYPQATENLYFSLMLMACIAIAYLFHQSTFTTDPRFYLFQRPLFNTLGITVSVMGLLFLYTIFYSRLPKLFYGIAGLSLLLLAVVWGVSGFSVGFGLIFLVAACVEMLRVVVVALVRHKPGARIIGLGIAMLALSFFYVFLMDMGLLPQTELTNELPFFGILGLILTMSIFLSRNIALTNRDLRRQIERVQELSEHKLQQEVERKLLEAEYKTKLQELEEARALQLSMLPESVPEHPAVELAAYMQTATEVGGDYYDFATDADGTLTLAVGDATGHGMKAGTMVTATKSLFNALGQESNLLGIFDRSTRALKDMNMRQLYMALTLAKFKDGRLRFATAGMPPTLVYRAATGEVETIRLKGMPLGSFVGFPYKEEEVGLRAGDTVLFMSDGFPELFNEAGDMLGYNQAVEVFQEIAARPAVEIIEQLVELGQSWSDGRPPDDDITFVVLKVRV
ncbi:MAG TPA: SpoIIE family protein phosphatase [Rhodothermales bacterium]|nr:SpoIIE family protein phosphatase [Rhodothermales bacterium]